MSRSASRFGYRRLHVLLRQEAPVVNCESTERLPGGDPHCAPPGRSQKGDGHRAQCHTRVGRSTSSTANFSSPAGACASERHRRRDEGVPCGRGRHFDLGQARGAGACLSRRETRKARADRLGSRDRVHLERHADLNDKRGKTTSTVDEHFSYLFLPFAAYVRYFGPFSAVQRFSKASSNLLTYIRKSGAAGVN